jgi:hypothetical protein
MGSLCKIDQLHCSNNMKYPPPFVRSYSDEQTLISGVRMPSALGMVMVHPKLMTLDPIMELLLAKGAHVYQLSNHEMSPLAFAVHRGAFSVVLDLLYYTKPTDCDDIGEVAFVSTFIDYVLEHSPLLGQVLSVSQT